MWDETYYAQAQIYMHYIGLTRHYLTCCAPGVRDFISVRTDYDPVYATRLVDKAHRLSLEEYAPPRISEAPTFFGCKWCDHHSKCHGKELPQVNCRTCASVTPKPDGTWVCEMQGDLVLTYDMQLRGCAKHRYNPRMLSGRKAVDYNEQTHEVIYDDGFIDGNKQIADVSPSPQVPGSVQQVDGGDAVGVSGVN